ncbi:hypothetical protein JOF56_007193 [Kibdelosporangium banguiense]|uniref:Uncharacterized protein n=1 Tax=Kibdelosporangium banguiense TaxID=1365924 RepID=A0ABS4TQW4_9PSEU|nr:hypothetical protein [Kibdelosporangium banguiense]MBP2326808.1 hypothetical protein [Kibdelosporangium banguiense]
MRERPAVNSEADRLRARMRWQKRQTGEPDVKVALLATYPIDSLVPYLGNALADSGRSPELWVAPVGEIERQCLDGSQAACFQPHLLVVAPRFEELWPIKPMPLNLPYQEYETGLRHLADVSIEAARLWDAELVFVLPAVPELRPAGVGDDGNAEGVLATAFRAREGVRRRLEGHAVVDAEVVLRSIGTRSAYRQSVFSEEYFELLAHRISRVVALRRHAHSPLIVLDKSIGATLDPLLDELTRLGALIERGQAKQVEHLATGAERVVFISPDPSAIAQVGREAAGVVPLLLPADRESWTRVVNDSGLVDQIPPVAVQHNPMPLPPDPVRIGDHSLSTEAREWITKTPLTR